jgi:hypothetical protein
VLITVDAPVVAAAYTRNFESLWDKRHTSRGLVSDGRADKRVRVVSPVVTSGAVLGTLA